MANKPTNKPAAKAENASSVNPAEKPASKSEAKKQLTFAELTALPPGDLFTYATGTVKLETAVEKAQTKFTESLQFSAKIVAAMKRLYVERLNKKEIAADTTFKAYWLQNAGGAIPGRVEALASLFNSLVLTLDAGGKPLLAEEHFDSATVDWLEKANAIVSAAQKKHWDSWKTCDDVLDVVNALSKPGNALKVLKEVRKRQKDAEKSSSEENTDTTPQERAQVVPLTIARAVAFLSAAIKCAGAMPEKDAFELFCDVLELGDTWGESGLKDETLNKWTERIDKARKANVNPKIEIVTPASPAMASVPAAAPAPALAA